MDMERLESTSSNCGMVEITLNYEGQEFTTFVTPTLLRVLEEDQNTLESYAKLVFEKEFDNKKQNVMVSSQPNDEFTSTLDSTLEEEKFQWTAKSTALLIETRLSMEKNFIKPTSSKKKLWKAVSATLNKYNYKVTEAQCDNKYRNLLHTYRLNKRKRETSGEGSITWEYFERFNSVLGHKESSYPSQNNLASSMPLDTPDENESISINSSVNNNVCLNVCEESESKSTNNILNQPVVKKRRVETLSMGRYLYLKNKRMEEIEAKKQEFREEKWKEEKELRRKEIDALNKLAKTLSPSSSNE